MAVCYLLLCKSKKTNYQKTYIGYSTNVEKRLKQHNGFLKNGAKSTRGYNNQLCLTVSGFSDKSDAMSFEYQWKKMPNVYGLEKRIVAAKHLALQWTCALSLSLS